MRLRFTHQPGWGHSRRRSGQRAGSQRQDAYRLHMHEARRMLTPEMKSCSRPMRDHIDQHASMVMTGSRCGRAAHVNSRLARSLSVTSSVHTKRSSTRSARIRRTCNPSRRIRETPMDVMAVRMAANQLSSTQSIHAATVGLAPACQAGQTHPSNRLLAPNIRVQAGLVQPRTRRGKMSCTVE